MTLFSRREFLLSSGALLALPAALKRAQAAPSASHGALVCVFLRGAADGLHAVVPHGDDDYYRLRGDLAVPRPGSGSGAAIDLDGFFGLNPAMSALTPVWESGDLAIVHATGLTSDSHSHFDAQNYMESGKPDDKSLTTGWVGRYLSSRDGGSDSPFRGIAVGGKIQKSLRGENSVSAVKDVSNYGIQVRGRDSENFADSLAALYLGDQWLDIQGQLAFDSIAQLEAANPAQYGAENGAAYPETPFGANMLQVAQLIKADIGAEALCVDIGGWDTHADQAARLEALLTELSASLAAFWRDLGERMSAVTVVVLSEFGRRVAANGSGGTDHGHGNALYVLGKGINGGQVFADWPGLGDGQLYGPGDLAITTDYRTVLAELVDLRLGNAAIDAVFPDFTPPRYIGLV